MTDETAHDALRATGRQAMREVLGDAYIARRDATTTPLNQAITSVSSQYGASGINGMLGQQMGTIDPNLGSAWNSNATTNGSYTINANTFGANQSSFSSSGGPVQTGTTSGGVPIMSGTGVSVSNPPPTAQQQQQQPTSVMGRLQGLLK